jgi:bifunctional DNase/RNase
MIEMFVTGVALDIRTNVPLVLLNDKERKYTLPIWIGQAEAQSIARALESIESERPMTHDLIVEMVDAMEASLESVEINSFEDTTFFASIILVDAGGMSLAVDSRPSDAIALALRVEAPIYVAESILTGIGSNFQVITEEEHKKLLADKDGDDFKEFLKYVKASDFSLKNIE